MSPWPSAPLGDVCTFLNGGTPSRSVASYWNGSTPWITGADISGPEISSARSSVTEEGIRSSATTRVPAGTLLLVTRTSVGKVAIADMELCFSQDITAVLPDQSVLEPRFVRHFLESRAGDLKAAARGATIKGVTRRDVARLTIPLPPLAEQRRIAAILDTADGLLAKRRATIAELDSLTRSIFLEMFGDPVSNPKGWPLAKLGTLAERVQIGPFGSLLHRSDYVAGGTPLVNPTHIVGGRIVTDSNLTVSPTKAVALGNYAMEPGDVVMGRRGEMGRCAVVTRSESGYLCGTGSLFIRSDTQRLVPEYLQQVLSHPRMKLKIEEVSLGITMANLNQTVVEGLPIPCPPIPAQTGFAKAIEACAHLSQSAADSLTRLDTLSESLQSSAFRSEL